MDLREAWVVQDEWITKALQIAKIGFWQYNRRTDTSSWSPEACSILGTPENDQAHSMDSWVRRVIHPDDMDLVDEARSRLQAGESYNLIYRIVRPDGETRFLHSTTVDVSGASDSLVFGLVRDVTEQKRLEFELLESKERYESLKKYNSDGICSLDTNGRIIRANPAFCKMTGYGLDELVGVPYIRFKQARRLCSHDHREENEFCLHRRTGECLQVSETKVPIVIRNHVVGTYAVLRDVTERNRQQEQLREAEDLLQLISNRASDVILISNPSGVCTYISPSVTQVLGYQASDIVGKSLWDYCHPDDVRHVLQAVDHVSDDGSFDRIVCRIYHRNGEIRWFETNLLVQRNVAGECESVVGIARDITDRKRSDEELVSLKTLYESILTATAEGIFGLDSDGKVTFANPAAIRAFHYTSSELVGRDFRELVSNVSDTPERTSPFVMIEEVFTKGNLLRVEHGHLLRRTGEMFPCEYTVAPMIEQGRVTGAVVTFEDTSDKLRTELEIQRNRENLRHAHQLAKLGYWELDVETRRLYWSDEMFELWGIGRDEFGGTIDALLETIVPSDRQMVAERIYDALDGKPFDAEYRIVAGDGTIRYIHALGETSVDGPEERKRFFGTVQDITPKRASEIALKESLVLLQQSEKLSAVGQLAAGVAHEIRNPLTALKGFIDLMRQRQVSDELNYFDIMKSEVSRMELIIGELLMLAKPQEVEYTYEHLEPLLKEVVSFMTSQAIMNNVVIETSFESDVEAVRCESNQLKQVFINILRNGIEAMPNGGTLRVFLVDNDTHVEVRFVDEGEGISEDKLARLGEPFFTTKQNGTGLGLMVTRRIIEEHDGYFKIESRLGQGTTVRIGLPITNR